MERGEGTVAGRNTGRACVVLLCARDSSHRPTCQHARRDQRPTAPIWHSHQSIPPVESIQYIPPSRKSRRRRLVQESLVNGGGSVLFRVKN